MNLYCLVEGRQTERKVYRAWLGHVFPHLGEVSRLEDVAANNFYLLSGNGYPSYLSRIQAALEDIVRYDKFDYFLICVDTEQDSVQQKTKELKAIIAKAPFFAETHIIVQNCCLETWLLGHAKFLRRNPQSQVLRGFKNFYNVSQDDPELMGCPDDYDIRAQFHKKYLKEMLREQSPKLRYTESNPGPVQERNYLDALVERYTITGHIHTFGNLVKLWQNWGGHIGYNSNNE